MKLTAEGPHSAQSLGKMSQVGTRPVFVVGSARSGTTMLYSMLMSSGRFTPYRTEPCVFDLIVPRWGSFETTNDRREIMRRWLRTRQFRRTGLEASDITEKVVKHVNTAGEFLCLVMGEMARVQSFDRWAVAGPDNLLYIPTIKRQIPNALFIHVIRDGRDVAYALEKKGFIRPFPWDKDYALYVSALHWMWKIQRGRRYGRAIGEDYMEVHFEDLVTRPQDALTKISLFVGEKLDYETILKSKIAAMDVPNTSFPEELGSGEFSPVARWKKKLSIHQVAALESLIGPLLVDIGYQLSCPEQAAIGLRLQIIKKIYPGFYQLKQWLKTATPLGRFVSMDRLHIDEPEVEAV